MHDCLGVLQPAAAKQYTTEHCGSLSKPLACYHSIPSDGAGPLSIRVQW